MEPIRCTLKSALKSEGRDVFPRPEFIRSPSFILNGEWLLCPDRSGMGMLKQWFDREFAVRLFGGTAVEGVTPVKVRVPFSLESEINQEALAPRGLTPAGIMKTGRFWYFRHFKRPQGLGTGLLKFGAVDYRASVWLNGELLGSHEGGYTPFSFPVERFQEDNILAVMVEDSLSMSQVRGKQTFLKKPFMVWYPGCTGIWQDVWIEPVGAVHIESFWCRRDGNRNVIFFAGIRGTGSAVHGSVRAICRVYQAQVYGKDRTPDKKARYEQLEISALDPMGAGHVEFEIPEKVFEKWSVEYPALHPVEIILTTGTSEYDRIYLLFGARSIEAAGGEIFLNKKKLYQTLLLNQGYYPRGHYTPVNRAEFRADVQLMKSAGFNGCRLHQKLEHPAFLYWADMLGFLVWEEMPSYYWPSRKNLRSLEMQLREAMQRDALHPSVITLVLYNESWGIYNIFGSRAARDEIVELYSRCREQYPGYLIIDNSGFHHMKTDVMDIHHYIPRMDETGRFYELLAKGVRVASLWPNFLKMLMGKENIQTPCLKGCADAESPLVISEFGGYGFGMYAHEELPLEEFLKKHLQLIAAHHEIKGLCYTQFTDTFQEKNGLFTIERKPKLPNLREVISRGMRR
ncbi:MAG: hypothetical protein EPN93_05210 [Spirochaetes bacterium]|nr:MAG: hypothetical protein EPN93_05210 [Spirochaetota bacterium]